MRKAPFLVAAVILGVVLALTQWPTAATAAPPVPNGTLRVTINAPEGVPADVVLTGVGGTTAGARVVAVKPTAGTSTVVTLTMPTGAYFVGAPRVTANGTAYVGRASRPVVAAVAPVTLPLDVVYTADGGAHDLHATAVGQTGIGLAWSAPAGSQFALRRTTGPKPAVARTQGVAVPVTGTTADDQGLQPGVQYSYALFTVVRGLWFGPVTLTAGTAPAPGSDQAAYIAPPTTLLATPANVVSTTTTGTGVQLVLQSQVPPPVIGAGVTLPISASLPGGYLGVVTSVSPDGRTIGLDPGAFSDAFDYYALDVESFGSGPVPPPVPPTSGGVQQNSLEKQAVPERAQTPSGAGASALSKNAQIAAPAAAPAAVSANCTSSASNTVSFTPDVAVGGSLKTTFVKKGFLGVDSEASLDMTLTTTVTGVAKVKWSGQYACSLKLPTFTKILTTTPVPISVVVTPSATFSISGALELDSLGITATGGVQVGGTMSLKNGSSFQGKTIATAAPVPPKITANGSVALKVGGDVTVGPGAGTSNAGVIAGVKGNLYPIDATFSPTFSATDSRFNSCLQAKAAVTAGLGLTAKAWLKDWKFEKEITVAALNGTFNYPGSPWSLPAGCGSAAPPGSDSLLGPGVTKVDDSIGGSPQQWGHVDGFAPGAKTWVLSTGLISNAVGVPSDFASTDMGGAGDAGLTAAAGHPTYDAATYQTTIVPTGSTLHVKYVFASEEYPEYVGSTYNDVMAVRVNGTNCATVPGSTAAVSINTINDHTNSAYYVDNSTGAAGYHTSMDGLTVPLTCSVPVVPGQPVTVQIVVADTSDHVYDSAVALVDGGIWTS